MADTANPAPLGLIGFGVTTVLLSSINAGLLPATGEPVVIPLAMAFGGTAQIIAGIMEFKTGNVFGATAFTSYGAFWWWFALLVLLGGNHILDLSGAGSAIGVCLLLWGVFTLGLWISTFRLSRLLFAIFLTLPWSPTPPSAGRSYPSATAEGRKTALGFLIWTPSGWFCREIGVIARAPSGPTRRCAAASS